MTTIRPKTWGEEPQLWIVSGPSSVGKSRFLASPRFAEITGTPPGIAHCVASHSRLCDERPLAVHYNIQRPLHQLLGKGRASEVRGSVEAHATDFSKDVFWRNILEARGETKAVVLAADHPRLINRVLRRRTIERADEAYAVDLWLERYSAIDVATIYRAWLTELESRSIPVVLVDARDDHYRLVNDADELIAIVEGRGADWTRERIEDTLGREQFEYQRVELPFGLTTAGSNRSGTRDLVLPPSLEGKSVLDVGSALGYFCFEAEARDATRVLGIEPKSSRYEHACILRDLKGSRVEFEQRDISADPVLEQWDLVLLLNVIHHLTEPIAVLRKLADVARERLVIEFPTFADPRYRRHRRLRFPSFYNRRPLIGVSSLVKGVAQTFIFSPEAIRAILLDHETSVRHVEFVPSPIPGRMIALANK